MAWIDHLAAVPPLWLVVCSIAGLLVGSFLNVLISRLPRMMEREWRQECSALLEQPVTDSPELSLAFPASHCPHCQTPIKAWQNIPVISWLLLRGRCAACSAPISVQYPIVEAVSAGLCLWAALHFPFGWATLAAMGLAWALLALTVIDAQTQLLPDVIVLPLLWAGLLVNLFELYVPLQDAVIGAMAGYMSLWLVYQAFKLATGKEGMGFGDFKLFAALGAWMGWQQLPWIILAASAVGAVVGITLMALKKVPQGQPIPFGPYLATAGWLAFLYGNDFSAWYLGQLT